MEYNPGPAPGIPPTGFDPGRRNRLVLPLASFLNDLAWETTVLLMPLFIVNVLGAGAIAVGVVEGVADATSSLVKVVSGVLADRTGRRQRITAFGYGIAGISRPFLYFVTVWQGALLIRFLERVGKGMRTSARDVLLADSTPPGETGRAFGLLRAADTFGAFGSLLVGLLVIFLVQGDRRELTGEAFRTLVAVATVPGLLAVAVIVLLAREVPRRTHVDADLVATEGLSGAFFAYVAVTCVFTLANSSDAFVILRSQDLGGTALVVIALMAGFNLVYGILSRPLGTLSDRIGKGRLIAAGWLVYAAVYLGFATATSVQVVALLLVPYGVYYAATEGIGRALVADYVPAGSRGAAFGIFHGAVGVSTLLASVVAGILYSRVSPAAPFYAGAGLAVVAAVALGIVRRPRGA